MLFGLALPHYDYSIPGGEVVDWAWVRDWAQRAEELGFSSVWISDHLFLDLEKYGGTADRHATLECFTALAALSSVTRSIRLGALVACNDLRHPALLAKMSSTLAGLSGGRFELGLGSGWYEPEYRAAKIPFDRAGVRISRMQEAIQVIRAMRDEEVTSFSGRHYSLDGAINTPRSPFRIWVGGKGDRTVSIAGRFADGYNAAWSWEPSAYRDRMKVLDSSARSHGRDPAEVIRSVALYALHGQGREEVESRWHRYLEASPVRMEQGVEEWSKGKLSGTTEEVVARLGAFAEMGVREVILGFGVLPFQIADESAVELFAREVFPRAEP